MNAAVADDVVVRRDVDETEKAEINALAAKAGTVEMVPIGLIEKSDIALRGAQRQTEDFARLLESVKRVGVLNSILVRKVAAPGGVIKYGLIDGLQRFTAASDAGLQTIPARIVEMDDAELLEAQIITNMNRIVTKPAELSKHLLRILTRNPFMTLDELALKTCQSKTWVEQRLSLNKLRKDILPLVNDGSIHLTNAYVLSKLPEEEQAEHVQAAQDEQPKTFVPRMKARQKEIRDAKNQGRDAGPVEFKPAQHLQKVVSVKREYEVLVEGKAGDSTILAVLDRAGISVDAKVMEALKHTVAWMLNYDAASQEEQRRLDEKRKKAKEETQARMKKEREEKKAKESAEKAASIL